jgi:uncharacterized protein YjbI with pentapeptide repeats
LSDASFNEVKWTNLEFIKSNLERCEFQKTKLKNLDVTGCVITNIGVDINNLKGLIVDTNQALILSTILGITIKD